MASSCATSSALRTPLAAHSRGPRASKAAANRVVSLSPTASLAAKRQLERPAAFVSAGRSSLRKHTSTVARSATGETAETEQLSATGLNTITVELGTEEAKQTILLQQIVKGANQIIFVSAVANSSNAEQAGVVPGQILRAMSHPTRPGELWELNGDERLRYVKDGIVSRHSNELKLWFDMEPTVSAADVAAFTGEELKEEEEEEEEPAPMQPVTTAAPPAQPAARERDDLYTDNWDGDQYKGSGWNELTVGLAVAVGAPILGLGFAAATYGTLWGTSSYAYLPF